MGPTGTMRAVFYRGARTFTPGKTAIPTAGPGEALLRVLRVGICGTDLHIFQGHLDNRVPQGGVIGHETFAEVLEAPPGSGVAAGDRVVVEPIRFCGTCRACRIGASYICYNLKVLGVDLPGGMQEYWPVPVDRLPRHLIDALVTAEDRRFYEHQGIDWQGVARAALVNLQSRSLRQDGSTLTQQVLKSTCFRSDDGVVQLDSQSGSIGNANRTAHEELLGH